MEPESDRTIVEPKGDRAKSINTDTAGKRSLTRLGLCLLIVDQSFGLFSDRHQHGRNDVLKAQR
jgi:hypothetical protein